MAIPVTLWFRDLPMVRKWMDGQKYLTQRRREAEIDLLSKRCRILIDSILRCFYTIK